MLIYLLINIKIKTIKLKMIGLIMIGIFITSMTSYNRNKEIIDTMSKKDIKILSELKVNYEFDTHYSNTINFIKIIDMGTKTKPFITIIYKNINNKIKYKYIAYNELYYCINKKNLISKLNKR
jgi:hypothetical protein